MGPPNAILYEVFMKKRCCSLVLFVLALALMLGLCGCASVMDIEKQDWYLGEVLSSDILRDPITTHVSDRAVEQYGANADLPRVDCTLTAKTDLFSSASGTLILTDNESGERYEGSFSGREEYSPEATGYSVTLGDKKGSALLQQYMRADEQLTRSLSITVGKTILVFYPLED